MCQLSDHKHKTTLLSVFMWDHKSSITLYPEIQSLLSQYAEGNSVFNFLWVLCLWPLIWRLRVCYYSKSASGYLQQKYLKAWKLSITRNCKVNSKHLCGNLGGYVNGENVLRGVKCYLLLAGILSKEPDV